MSEAVTEPTSQPNSPTDGLADGQHEVYVIGPDGQPVQVATNSAGPGGQDEGSDDESLTGLTDLVEQPAKVMRIGSMIRMLLEEVKSAPLDEASRSRLKEIHQASIKELEAGLAPELIEELDRLTLPFTEDGVPSESELRIAQAQLVGWLEGLFHGIQTAIYAQQMAARAQLEQMRKALPAGMMSGPNGPGAMSGHGGHAGQPHEGDQGSPSSGMYL